jgi:hypothetical protein
VVAEEVANGSREAPGFSNKRVALRIVLELTIVEVAQLSLPAVPQ